MPHTYRLGRISAAVFALGCHIAAQSPAPKPTLLPGSDAPPLALGRRLKGEPIDTMQRGRVHVIEFWATWCGPCRAAMPHLTELARRHADRVTFVGVSVWETDEERIDPTVEQMGDEAGFTLVRDRVDNLDLDPREGAMTATWLRPAGVTTLPTTFVVDGEGAIAWIGDPTSLPGVLDKVLEGSWDNAASRARYLADREGPGAFEAARAALDAGQWPEAERRARQAVDAGLEEARVIEYASAARLRRGADVDRLGRELLQRFAGNWAMLEWVARTITEPPVFSSATDLDLALDAAQAAVDLLDAWPTRTTLAHVQFLRGDKEPAIAALAEILESIPAAEAGRRKFVDRLQQYRNSLATEPLAILQPLLGAWTPVDQPQRIVMDLRPGIGPFSLRLVEGFRADHPEEAQLDGLIFHDPVTGVIGFTAIAGAAPGQGRVFHGEYRPLADGAIERTYDVHYRSTADMPGEELGGVSRRFREVYRIDGERLQATLDWWLEERWQPFGRGRYELRRSEK